jgi:threonine synthase
MNKRKYFFECRNCGNEIDGFRQWFGTGQQCPSCGSKWVDVRYPGGHQGIARLVNQDGNLARSLFHYFDFLPLDNPENIISLGEGTIPVDRWTFLEEFAREHYNLDLTVLAYRNDLNAGTGTFKDVAAAMAASVLRENGINEYCVASTGNIANAFACYMAKAGVSLSVFIPEDALRANEAGVGCYGQRVFRVKGDYALAKKICAEFSKEYNIPMSGGNIDPARVEAKRTQVFEWIRQLGYIPDVYIQSLAGGTGPIAIDKGLNDIRALGLFDHDPRYVLVQASGCNPMTVAWENAKKTGYPDGWTRDFPVFDKPATRVPTLANGNPQTYPILAPLVKKTGGEFITFNEDLCSAATRLVAFETTVKPGPAAAVAVGGFFEALKQGILKNGERVIINIGEGIHRSPELLDEMIYTTKWISEVGDCKPFNRADYRNQLYVPFIN